MTAPYYPRVLTGMCRTATDGKGQLIHAVPTTSEWDTALCGVRPGLRSNGWSSWPAPSVTCPECIKKLEAQP